MTEKLKFVKVENEEVLVPASEYRKIVIKKYVRESELDEPEFDYND